MTRWLATALPLALLGTGCHSGDEQEPAAAVIGTTQQALDAPPVSSNASNFNGTAIAAGRYVWFTSVVKVSGVGASPAHIFVDDAHIKFTANGKAYDLPVPNAMLTVTPSGTSASTQYNTSTGRWETAVPKSLSGNAFVAGLSYLVPENLPGGIGPVTWTGQFKSDTPGVSANWQWAAAVYTTFGPTYPSLGVKPVDDSHISEYLNSDHAGTPEAFKAYVTGGARGGGGSNYTGSLSGTVSVTMGVACQGIVCPAAGVCRLAGACDPATELCSGGNAPAGTSCSDGDPCNGAETCDALGACTPGTPPVVDDGDPCTLDACGAEGSVTHVQISDDGDPCTLDTCTDGIVTHEPAQRGTSCGAGFACDGAGTCTDVSACEPLCVALVGAGECLAGLTVEDCVGTICFPTDACVPAMDALTACGGDSPVAACEGTFGFAIQGCDAEFVRVIGCFNTGTDPTSGCVESCLAMGGAGCAESAATRDFCLQTCFGAGQQGCAAARDALATCAGAAPVGSCGGTLGATVDGCDREVSRLAACVLGGPGATGCGDACSGSAAAECSGLSCLTSCSSLVTSNGCGTQWETYFACAGTAAQVECVDGFPYAVGCDATIAESYLCSTGTCFPSPDGNSCTADACDASGAVAHIPLGAGTSCSSSDGGPHACSPGGICVDVSACEATCSALVQAGCEADFTMEACRSALCFPPAPCAQATATLLACASESPTVTCGDTGRFQLPGCDAELLRTTTCLATGEDPTEGCIASCVAIGAASCGGAALSLDACVQSCASAGEHGCVAERDALAACASAAPAASCTGTLGVTVTGCDVELARLAACTDGGPDAAGCGDLCAATPSGQCPRNDCVTTCAALVAAHDCAPSWETYFGCAGTSPPLECVAGVPFVAGCDAEIQSAYRCSTGGCLATPDGNPCTADACDASGTVTHAPVPAGTTCGSSDGVPHACSPEGACVDVSACEATCSAVAQAGCGDGFTMEACRRALCFPPASCADAVGSLFTCAGASPTVSCSGSPGIQVAGCDIESLRAMECLATGEDPTEGCIASCVAIGAASCGGAAMSRDACVQSCASAVEHGCLPERDALAACAGAAPVASCTGTLGVTVTGCDVELARLAACTDGGPDAAGCGDLCAATPTGQCSGIYCVLSCVQRVNVAGCGLAWQAYLTCAADAPELECVNGLPFAAACDAEIQEAYQCSTGSCFPYVDGNPCTSDTCDPGTGLAHAPLPAGTSCTDGQLCNGEEVCDGAGHCGTGPVTGLDDGNPCTRDSCFPTGVIHAPEPPGTPCYSGGTCSGTGTCIWPGTESCASYCSAMATVGCYATWETCYSSQCNPIHDPCEGEYDQLAACARASGAGSCGDYQTQCADDILALQRCNNSCFQIYEPCSTLTCSCTPDACERTVVTLPVGAPCGSLDGACAGQCTPGGRCSVDLVENSCTGAGCYLYGSGPTAANGPCGLGRSCDTTGTCAAGDACASFCASVGAACGDAVTASECEAKTCPLGPFATCQGPLDAYLTCAGGAPGVTCGGEDGFTIPACAGERLDLDACLRTGRFSSTGSLCSRVALSDCGVDAAACTDALAIPPGEEGCQDAVDAVVACSAGGTITCGGPLGFQVGGCDRELDLARECSRFGPDAMPCVDLCNAVGAAGCGLTTEQCLVECPALAGGGVCEGELGALATCAGSTPTITCTPDGLAPFTVAGCEQPFAESLTCATGPCPVFGDADPCTADQCDAVNGQTHPLLPAGTPCGEERVCDGAGACVVAPSCRSTCAAIVGAECVGATFTQEGCEATLCPSPSRPECDAAAAALTACAGAAPAVSCAADAPEFLAGCDRELLDALTCPGAELHDPQCIEACAALQSATGCESRLHAELYCVEACVALKLTPGCEQTGSAFSECLVGTGAISCSSGAVPLAFPGCEASYGDALACDAAGCVIPADDGNPCTVDLCAGPSTSHSPVPDGTPCGIGRTCDASGECVVVPDCADVCPAVVDAGCVDGLTVEQCSATLCSQPAGCAVAMNALSACAGDQPVVLCDAGQPVIQGCEPELANAIGCIGAGGDPTGCMATCSALAGSSCGPTLEACLGTCQQALDRGCGPQLDDLRDCAGSRPEVSCDGAPEGTIVACERALARVRTCAEAGEPAVGCVDLCGAVDVAGCTTEAGCLASCIDTAAGACATGWTQFLACAGAMPAVECQPIGSLPFAVRGCEDQEARADACLTGTCTPAPDWNPCTLDGCSPTDGPTHVVTAGLSCGPHAICDAAGACVDAGPGTTACETFCEGVVALGCNSLEDCTAQCASAGTTCAPYLVDAAACAAASPVTSCANVMATCDDAVRTANACGSGCTDDENPCTQVSCSCEAGACARSFAELPVGTPCSSADLTCAGACVAGALCRADGPASPDPCVAAYCTSSGAYPGPVPDGTTCSDGNPCSLPGVCAAGTCAVGTTTDPDDGNPCTIDTCDPETAAAVHTVAPDGTPCPDSDLCNGTETCSAGVCQGAPATPTLDDGNPCTADACTPSEGVTHTPLPAGTSCADGDACNGAETCDATGLCVSGAPAAVDDQNACTVDTCDPGSGVHHAPVADGTSCDDHDACTTGETCAAGNCGGSRVAVDDGNPCTTDACDAETGAVSHAALANGTQCSDGNACTAGEVCQGASCGGGNAVPTDDHNPCTVDSCDPVSGVHHALAAAGATCSDGNACNGLETCNGLGACLAGPPPVLSDGNPCTKDVCSPSSGVAHLAYANGTPCDDGNECNGDETCQSGACRAGVPPVLDDHNSCTVDTCDAQAGVTHAPLPAGTPASDGDPCNGDEVCGANGTPMAGTPVNTNDGNPCTVDACSASTGVTHTALADGTACSDGSACTTRDACQQGACIGAASDIDDGNPCTSDACDAATGFVSHTVRPEGASCSDGDACNGVEVCDAQGLCSPGAATRTDDHDPCTVDACDPLTGAVSHQLSPGGSVCGPSSYCNGAGNCEPTVPPDPATLAPPVNLTTTTSLLERVSFLFTGDHPIQTGVAPDAIDARTAAVVRGRVTNRAHEPIPGVAVEILGHPELGGTRTRADGMYDLVVNGGGKVTLTFSAEGHVTAQRGATLPWNDTVVLEDVVLIAVDPVVTQIALGVPYVQSATGSPVVDQDGARQARVFFEPGTTAEMDLPDGTTEPLDTLSVHLTEFTVGPDGPSSMPAELPATSGYTYALELSAEEATAAGATTVRFDRPVALYVENFLGIPTGTIVPLGLYDRESACWKPEPNGRVVELVSVTDGLADLDVDGTGVPSTPARLEELGITTAERAQLAETYPVGARLWRMPVSHWSPGDGNFPKIPDDPKPRPKKPKPPSPGGKGGTGADGSGGDTSGGTPNNGGGGTTSGGDDECSEPGASVVNIQSQTLSETVKIAGTSLTLNYRSDRVPGRRAQRTLTIPVSTSDVGTTTQGFSVEVSVAGRTYEKSLPAEPNLTDVFEWDGLDAYGRLLTGSQPATVSVGRIVPAVYAPPSALGNAFAAYSDTPNVRLTTDRARDQYTIWSEYNLSLGGMDARDVGVAGWTFDVHHWYDPYGRVLHEGSGSSRSTATNGSVIDRYAGIPFTHGVQDGLPALYAELGEVTALTVAADGAVYYAGGTTVRRIDPATTRISMMVGDPAQRDALHDCEWDRVPADGGLALQAGVCGGVSALAVEPDGSVLVADSPHQAFPAGLTTYYKPLPRLRRITPDGRIHRVAGGVPGPTPTDSTVRSSGDGGPALAATFQAIVDVAAGSDCSIYVLDGWSGSPDTSGALRRITCDGNVRTVVPALLNAPSGDGASPGGVAVGPDGTVYVTDQRRSVVKALTPDGQISIVAGRPSQAGFSGDGGPATAALLNDPEDVAVARDGTLLIADAWNGRVRIVGPDGVINTLAGGVNADIVAADGQPPLQAVLLAAHPFALAPDGALYLALVDNTIRRMRPTFPGGVLSANLLIPARDGREVYEFDRNGRHLRTRHGLTGSTLYSFGYDGEGRLGSVTDGSGNQTTVTRDGSGKPVAITSPYGHVTLLGADSNGFLSLVRDPAGAEDHFTYTPDGLMTSRIDPRNGLHAYTWDEGGYLLRDESPAGGTSTLERIAIPDGEMVRRETGAGRVATFATQHLATGETLITNHLDDGLPRTLRRNAGAQTAHLLLPDGTETSSTDGPAPRWGMLAPLTTSSTTRTPSGLSLSTSRVQSLALGSTLDPFDIRSLVDRQSVNGVPSTATYAGSTLTQSSTSPAGRPSTTQLDPLGRVIQIDVPGVAPVHFTYDARGRLSTVQQADRTTTNTYDAQGNLVSVQDPLLQVETYDHDAVGRVTARHRPDGAVVGFAYDAAGNLTAVTPPGRPAHQFAYTPDNRLADYIAPPPSPGAAPAVTHYQYDSDGMPTSVLRPDGSLVTMGYDSARRMTTLSMPGSPGMTFGYSPTTGQLKTVTGPYDVNLAYAYDGRLLTDTTWSGALTATIHRTHDTHFRLHSETINGLPSTTATFAYDPDGLVTSVATPAGAMSLTWDPTAPRLATTTLGGVTDSRAYDAFGQLSRYQAKFASSTLYDVTYVRDPLGRILAKDETIQGDHKLTEYGYDQAGRLVTVAEDGSLVRQYTYDANGNRTMFEDVEHGTTTLGTYDDQDRMLTYGNFAYTYTEDGATRTKTDTTTGEVTTYGYDALGNLVRVDLPDGRVIEYVVDGDQRRVLKKVNGVAVKGWLYSDDLRIVAETDGAGSVVSRFVWADGTGAEQNILRTLVSRLGLTLPDLLARVRREGATDGHLRGPAYVFRGGDVFRIVSDHLGTPLMSVHVLTGAIVARTRIDEWGVYGEESNSGWLPQGFAGGLYDADTGMVRFGARDYVAGVGRWTRPDPVRFGGSAPNLYSYALWDPTNVTDVSGLDTRDTCIHNCEGIFGAGMITCAFCAKIPHPVARGACAIGCAAAAYAATEYCKSQCPPPGHEPDEECK